MKIIDIIDLPFDYQFDTVNCYEYPAAVILNHYDSKICSCYIMLSKLYGMYMYEHTSDGAEDRDKLAEDLLIGEQYEDEIRKEEKVNSIEKVFGIKDVYASDVVSEDTKNADGGTIKQAVILTYTGKKISGCKEVLVYCVSTWITPPRNRGYDVAGVTLKNLTPYEGVNAYYYVTEYDHSNPGRVIERLCNVKCEHKENENGMAVYFNLEDDKSYAYYKNHKIVFYFYALVDNELQKHVTASGHYYHKTSHLNVTPGISIGYDSITVCVSVSTSTKVTELPLNVKSTMIFK